MPHIGMDIHSNIFVTLLIKIYFVVYISYVLCYSVPIIKKEYIMRIYTYNVVAENKNTGDFYISESNIESKDTAYSLFDVLVAEGKYNHVRVDRTAVTVNALPNNKTEILVSDRWLDKHYNSEVTKGVIGYDSFSGLQSH